MLSWGQRFEENPNKDFDICVIDIEQFKTVNEVFGTKVGDRFLMDLALCLTEFKINDSALLTRARADTFFALLSHTDFIMLIIENFLLQECAIEQL